MCLCGLYKKKLKMGRKKLERQSVESLFSTVSSMLVPEHVLEHFEIWGACEYKNRWVIEMREKEGFIPSELAGCEDVVFDGYFKRGGDFTQTRKSLRFGWITNFQISTQLSAGRRFLLTIQNLFCTFAF